MSEIQPKFLYQCSMSSVCKIKCTHRVPHPSDGECDKRLVTCQLYYDLKPKVICQLISEAEIIDRQVTSIIKDTTIENLPSVLRRLVEWQHLPPSELCKKYIAQNCHACENADCDDNMTPSIIALKQIIKTKESEAGDER